MTPTPLFPGFPVGVTSGSYDMTFDMTMASSYNAPFLTANGGDTTAAFNALLAAHVEGRAYFNIHTTAFGGGEIRGFFIPTPGGGAALALGGVMMLARRRRG